MNRLASGLPIGVLRALSLLLLLLVTTTAGAQTPYPGGTWEPGPARYSTTAPDSLTITTFDGVGLQALVWYPADPATGERAGGDFPVIMEMTPYPRLRAPLSPIEFLTGHGYIYLVVRPRGSGGSEGRLQQFSSIDGRDGATVAAWAARDLPGSDGRVGLIGCSYPGGTALATAAYAGPGSPVKAVVAACIGLDMQHRQVWTTNGLPNAALSAYAPRAAAIMGGVESAATYFADFYASLMAGGPEAYDGYWDHRLPLAWAGDIARNEIPTLLWSGWDDINETGALHAFVALQNAAAGRPIQAPMAGEQPPDPRYQLLMGNWGHAQGLDAGVMLQWFETWLKGVETGIGRTETPMHLFETGTNRWVNVARYPLVAAYTDWYLAPGHALVDTVPDAEGTAGLRWAPPDAEGGRLVFETPPFAEGATLAGPISVTAYARSSNTNLALIAKLYDVAPDGTAERVSFGALLGSQHRLDADRSWTGDDGTVIRPWPMLRRDEFLTPGEVYRLEIPLAARQWAVAPNHRLRLELTTQSPSEICPDEGDVALVSEPCRLTLPQRETLPGGRYTLLFGPQYPSALHLPQLPWHAFETARSGPPPADWTDEPSPYLDFTLPLVW